MKLNYDNIKDFKYACEKNTLNEEPVFWPLIMSMENWNLDERVKADLADIQKLLN